MLLVKANPAKAPLRPKEPPSRTASPNPKTSKITPCQKNMEKSRERLTFRKRGGQKGCPGGLGPGVWTKRMLFCVTNGPQLCRMLNFLSATERSEHPDCSC